MSANLSHSTVTSYIPVHHIATDFFFDIVSANFVKCTSRGRRLWRYISDSELQIRPNCWPKSTERSPKQNVKLGKPRLHLFLNSPQN